MKVVLRKEDSSTSSLLFIYNTVYTRTQKTSFNLASLLEIMSRFDKAETATRMSLSRSCKAGVLETNKTDKDVVYSLTPIALDFIKAWNLDAMACWKRFALRNTSWDGKWHFVHIAPIASAKKNDLSDKLQQVGYNQINVQTWLSPYQQAEAVKVILGELEIEAVIAAVHGDFFVSAGMDTFLHETYGLDGLRAQYAEFLGNYQPVLETIKEDPMTLADGKALPMLHKLGFAFFSIATSDPMLPRALLPVWPGDAAASLMRDLRAILESAAWDYLKEFR